MEKRRLCHLELLRVLAILLVVWNHSAGYTLYMAVPTGPAHGLLMLLSAFDKIAVPLFFMISGALLLPKRESLSALLRRRVLRMLLVLLLFSLLSYLLALRRSGERFSLYFFLSRLYAYHQVSSYWYLYAYLGFLLSLPFLRAIAARLDEREWLYLPGLMLAVQGADLLQALLLREELFADGSFQLFPVSAAVFFPLFGYWLEHRLPARFLEKRFVRASVLPALLALLAMLAAAELVARRRGGWSGEIGEVYFGRLCFVVAGAVYCQAKTWCLRQPPGEATAKLLARLGSCCFGIYLLQHLLIEWTQPLTERLGAALGVFAASWVQTLLVCVLAGGLTLLLKQIPGLRKLL